MKTLFTLVTLFLSTLAFSQTQNLKGEWKLKACTQTQINGKSGYVIEIYTFDEAGDFTFTRTWFDSPNCVTSTSGDQEMGKVKLGPENLNNGFNPAGTVEADFSTNDGEDKGLLLIKNGELRVARGLTRGMRNTMLSYFIYVKSDL